MISSIIQLQNVGLALPSISGQVPILNDVNLEIGQGEAVAVTGASGSGKTSLLMLVAGLESPTQGQITVCGESIARMREDAIARFRARNIGIVFQSFHLMPTMTALENVCLPLELLGVAHARQKAADTLSSLGLGHRLTHYPAQLSGGEQQRVAIARAFAPEPKLLLADEPTGNLDHATGAQVMDLLFEQHRKNNTTLVLVTHEQRLAERCQRIITMHDGRIA